MPEVGVWTAGHGRISDDACCWFGMSDSPGDVTRMAAAHDDTRMTAGELPARREVYLDYAAATPVSAEVFARMLPLLTEVFYNPSAPYALAREAKAALEDARMSIARVLGTRAGNVTFTAGATEANNLALAAVDGGLACAAIEHESVLAGVMARGGTLIEVDAAGRVDTRAVRKAIGPRTELVSVSLANGEIGSVQPVRELSRVVAEERMRRLEEGETRPLLLHTDASQAAGYLSLNVSTLGVDLMTISAAKMYGPKQVGLLWHADGVPLRPLTLGGGQEGGLRSGTENVAGVVGLAQALEDAERLRASEARRLGALSMLMRRLIARGAGGAVFAGPANPKGRLPGLVHVSFADVEARRLVIALERRGVSVGTGSACAASKMRVSHVLRAIGYSDELAAGSVRISLGRATSEQDVRYAAQALVECVRAERERMRH